MSAVFCPVCGSSNVDLHYEDPAQKKYHFHCHDCNLYRENVVSINHPIEEIMKDEVSYA